MDSNAVWLGKLPRKSARVIEINPSAFDSSYMGCDGERVFVAAAQSETVECKAAQRRKRQIAKGMLMV